MMMLELEDPNVEEEERRFLNKQTPSTKKTSKNGTKYSKDVTPLGRKNRTLHVIVFTSLISLLVVVGSFLFSGQDHESTRGTIKKHSLDNSSTNAFPKEETKHAKNVSTIIQDGDDIETITPNPLAEAILANLSESQLPTESDSVQSTTAVKSKPMETITTDSTHEKLRTPTEDLVEFGSEEYLQHMDIVVKRAMSAILEEYGQVNPFSERSNTSSSSSDTVNAMFDWDKIDVATATDAPEAFQKRGNRGNGGWTTSRSWTGLILRLIQALKQQNDFTVVLAGHSAAAGHGNHFHQSYLMQFHKVMEPVLRQLGVTLIARNQAQGGLGTVQSSLGFNSIYGADIDLMLWDSGMTENNHVDHIDLFFRQALMVEGKLPVVWGAGGKFDLLKIFHTEADADVGEYGIGWNGIPVTNDEVQVETLPWAAQHLKCDQERPDLCRHPHKFCATCWIDRPDGKKPAQTQYDAPHGQVKWHPGWRHHQLQGRVLAFSLLLALRDAIDILRNNDTLVAQNMTAYYDNIRRKMKELDPSLGHCYKLEGVPSRICRTPMKGRTQYTPRANPTETSVSSLVKAAPPGNYLPQNRLKALYDGPDVHNPCFDLPEGAIDVIARINDDTRHRARILKVENITIDSSSLATAKDEDIQTSNLLKNDTDIVVPGRGWQIFDEPQGFCDGSYDSICAKSTFNRCVLYGHHDERGAVLGSEMAGWLVMQLPRDEIKAGLIILKLHTWYEARDNSRTVQWTSVNNQDALDALDDKDRKERQGLPLEGNQVKNVNGTEPDNSRKLRKRMYVTPELNDWFQFEFAIDGVITTWNKTEFLAQKQDLARMVETVTLVDDESFTTRSGSIDKNSPLEVAIRLRGCYHRCVFGVTHVYWA